MPDIDNEFVSEREEANDCDSYTVAVVGNQGDIKSMIFHDKFCILGYTFTVSPSRWKCSR